MIAVEPLDVESGDVDDELTAVEPLDEESEDADSVVSESVKPDGVVSTSVSVAVELGESEAVA